MGQEGTEGLPLAAGAPTAHLPFHDVVEAGRALAKDAAGQKGGSPLSRLVGAAPERVPAAYSGLRNTSTSVMINTPKTLPARASVDDVRAQMADDHVHMVLVTDGDKLCGTLVRTDLPPAASGNEPALRWAVLGDRTVPPDTPAALVHARLTRTNMRRLAVVDIDQTLLGLVCLKRSRSGFCSDADVAARNRAAAANPENGDGEST